MRQLGARPTMAGIEALRQRLVTEDSRWSLISRTIDRLVVLHNPDQVAGGPGEIPNVPIPPAGHTLEQWNQYFDQLSPFYRSQASETDPSAASGDT